MSIKVQCFAMFGEVEPFVMKPATSSTEADTLSDLHVYVGKQFDFKIVLQASGDLFLHRVRPIYFCSLWKHLLRAETGKFCRIDGPFV